MGQTLFERETMKHSSTQKFSDLLSSPCIAVTVGSDDAQKTFYLHEALLCYESDRFVKQLKGGFSESTTRCIPECDEDPDLFGYFVEYLYRDGLVNKNNNTPMNDCEYVRMARLYSMGERLGAERFQTALLWKFSSNFNSNVGLPSEGIFDLLEVVCTELPERAKEDPLRDLVFWYAAYRLSSLRLYPKFQKLLQEVPDLGRYLCLRAGNGSQDRPVQNVQQPGPRFKREEDI